MNQDFDIDSIASSLIAPDRASEHLVIGVYGRPGVGKTTFCASAAKVEDGKPNTLIIDTESGYRSLRGQAGVRIYRVRQWPDILKIWHLLQATPDMGGFEGGVIAIDTLSTLVDLAVRYVAGDTKINMNRLITSESSQATLADYGEAGRYVLEVISKFALLGDRATIVFTMHQNRLKSQSDDAAEVIPDLTPMVYKAFRKVPDLLGYITAIGNEDPLKQGPAFTNTIHFEQSSKFESKNRISGRWIPAELRIPDTISNPSLRSILSRYRKSLAYQDKGKEEGKEEGKGEESPEVEETRPHPLATH